MIEAVLAKSRKIKMAERRDDRLYLFSEHGTHRIEPKNERTVRVTYTVKDEFSNKEKPGIVCSEVYSKWQFEENEDFITVRLPELIIRVNRETGSYSYFNMEGDLLLKERDIDSKNLDEFDVYELADANAETEKIETADGTKQIVRDAGKIKTGTSFHTRIYYEWTDEALYGLGQQEEGLPNLRGNTVYVHQANRKIAIPMLVSTKGYGILTDTYSPLVFSDTCYGSYIYTEADPEIDIYFANGGSPDGVIKEYRFLTGKASMLPKWAFGYIQSQERYETENEIVDIVKQTREHGLSIDCVVLDWLSWKDGEWGQKTFDKERFSDAKGMVSKVHDMNAHFMISIWPAMNEITDNYKEFKEAGLLLPGNNTYNPFKKEGRDLYWKQISEELWPVGVDAWWCDSSEAFTPEWFVQGRMEPSKLYEEFNKLASTHMPAEYVNSFCLYHAQGIYENQRAAMTEAKAADSDYREKRVCNLTRSAYTGQQRYGTIMWSGDIDAKWSTYREQICNGLNFCASGIPYWTLDIGAFFVKHSDMWYWKGDYDKTTEDLGYRELFARWYQQACFLPLFRVHGTDCRRELWYFGEKGEPFYDAIEKANKLRYELMPYIYSLAGKVWLEDGSMIKPLSFAFPKDKKVWDMKDQYMFGDSMMVCPVTEPMYYESGSRPLSGVSKTREVYFPEGCNWINYFTGERYSGGSSAEVAADIDTIPVFVTEGSIIPTVDAALSTQELSEDICFRIYGGADAEYKLYLDDGDGYDYEQGKYELISYHWDDKSKMLTESRNGISTEYMNFKII